MSPRMATVPIMLPSTRDPAVSIVVMLTGHVDLAAGVLGAVAGAHDPALPCEVVVVVNTTDAETRSFLEGVHGARIVERAVNTGTAVGWNLGFDAACGRWVALLHEDSAPEPGWLREGLAVAEPHPNVGSVGCRLLNPDGTFQGGGIIAWRDGNVSWVKEDSVPNGLHPYPISHASTAAMLVKRDAFEAVGGFDERYFPAYRVEVDFGTALWAAGYSVLSAPRSVVRHRGGTTVKKNTGPLATGIFVEFLQERNRQRWLAKWPMMLSRHPSPPTDGSRRSPETVSAALEWVEARSHDPPPLFPPGPTAARPLTGGDEAHLDERLESAHAEVQAAFLVWLVERLRAARAQVGELRAETSQLRAETSALHAETRQLRVQVSERGDHLARLRKPARRANRAERQRLLRASRLRAFARSLLTVEKRRGLDV